MWYYWLYLCSLWVMTAWLIHDQAGLCCVIDIFYWNILVQLWCCVELKLFLLYMKSSSCKWSTLYRTCVYLINKDHRLLMSVLATVKKNDWSLQASARNRTIRKMEKTLLFCIHHIICVAEISYIFSFSSFKLQSINCWTV